ncbi:MAG TPA: hypothetical protein VEM38_07905 [Burkholderiales bacterium]|nr:hypothetical protein [Burkholderiales bacterium]
MKSDPGTPTDAEAGASRRIYMIVTQVKSNRVLYFTDDPDYSPPMDEDWYYVSSHDGELPKGMSLRNCWRWRFNGGAFKDTRPESPPKDAAQRLLDHNRAALLAILNEKIDAIRGEHAPSCRLGSLVRAEKLREAGAFFADGLRGESPYLEAVAAARSITLAEAARLVLERAQAMADALTETEPVRERFKQAICAARTEEELLSLRERLLTDVYPQLSERFALKIDRTVPVDPHQPLPEPHLVHERSRLHARLATLVEAGEIEDAMLAEIAGARTEHELHVISMKLQSHERGRQARAQGPEAPVRGRA